MNKCKKYYGDIIEDPTRRKEWIELVSALHDESEKPDGRLAGWVFHGSGGKALSKIRKHGLKPHAAMVSTEKDVWDNYASGVHFGTASIAAYFAEDKIEALERQDVELSIFGVRLDDLQFCGRFAADGQMVDVPIPTRIKAGESVWDLWEKSEKDWKASLAILESLVVLGPVPSTAIVEFTCLRDLDNFLNKRPSSKPKI